MLDFAEPILILDSRSGLNRGHPTTVIPKAVRPSHKKGVKTLVEQFGHCRLLADGVARRRPSSSRSSERSLDSPLTRSESWSC